jgi:hypothetical protein
MTLGGKLALAPLPEKLNRALDIGTGTGIWAMDFGWSRKKRLFVTLLTRVQS